MMRNSSSGEPIVSNDRQRVCRDGHSSILGPQCLQRCTRGRRVRNSPLTFDKSLRACGGSNTRPLARPHRLHSARQYQCGHPTRQKLNMQRQVSLKPQAPWLCNNETHLYVGNHGHMTRHFEVPHRPPNNKRSNGGSL